MCLKGSSEICVRPAEPDLDIRRTPTREHYSHQHHGVAGTGVAFSLHGSLTLMSSPLWLSPWHQLYYRPWKVLVDNKTCFSCYFAVCSWVTPWTGPAHCVHLLCCWCSSRFQHYCNTDPEIVSHCIQNLYFSTMFMVVDCQRIPGNVPPNFESVLLPGFLSLPQFSSILGSIHLPRPSNFC